MRPGRGAMKLPISVNVNDGVEALLQAGLRKLSCHDQKFIVHCPPPHLLLYPDGSPVNDLPEGGPFTVQGYKETTGRDYNRLILYMCSRRDYGQYDNFYVLIYL
jgi:hypothetical protein